MILGCSRGHVINTEENKPWYNHTKPSDKCQCDLPYDRMEGTSAKTCGRKLFSLENGLPFQFNGSLFIGGEQKSAFVQAWSKKKCLELLSEVTRGGMNSSRLRVYWSDCMSPPSRKKAGTEEGVWVANDTQPCSVDEYKKLA